MKIFFSDKLLNKCEYWEWTPCSPWCFTSCSWFQLPRTIFFKCDGWQSILMTCEQYYFVSEKDLTKCEQLEWIPSFHWWFPSCSWSQFPRTARDRRTCKELTGSTQLLNDFYQSQKFWEQKKSGQSLDLTFALKVRFVRCTYRTTASRCSLDPLKISFVGIFCFLTLLLKQKSLSVSFDTYTCLNQVSIKVKSGATVQVNTWTTTWLPSLPRRLPQQLRLLNSLHLIIQVFISDWKNGWMFCLFLIIDLSFARDCEI